MDATTIEGRLSSLWTELQKETPFHGAVRTHVFNLVVCADDQTGLNEVAHNLAHLAMRHPSRTIILVGRRTGSAPSIDARVQAFCTETPDQPPLCHEQIEIRAHGRAADHLDSVAVPLLRPELRTYLWWTGQPPFGQRRFHRLLDVADQVVVDSARFQSPGDGMANLVRLASRKQGTNDFNWSRLTPWREIIAQFFDGPSWVQYARSFRSLKLQFGKGGDVCTVTSEALLLLGWLSSHLGWEPESPLDALATEDIGLAVLQGDRVLPIEVTLIDRGDKASGKLLGLEIVSQPRDAPPARFTVARTGDLERVTATTSVHERTDLARVIPLHLKSPAQLLSDELDVSGHDRVYEAALECAARLAGRDVWVPA